MTPERWQQVDQLLQEALARGPAERAAFLDAACAGDDELRREVTSLLDFHERAEGFIATPPAEMAAELLQARESRSGQAIGHYQLLHELGRGGMGEVYLARDTRLGRQVALKLLPPRFTEDAQRVQRFRQEARAASALNHPNIIVIHEIGEAPTDWGNTHFIATEFIEGHTLRDLIRSGGMTISDALEVASQAASALAAAHEAGITHRDIKPENIMLRPDGYVKVLDFGLAKLNERPMAGARSDEVETDPGSILGTVSYMSPEQARGLETDARSDIFSLGVVLYEMITAHRPFVGETTADEAAALLRQEPPPLAEYAPDAPAELQRLVSRMLAKDRNARYQTANELRRALKSLKKRLAPAEEFTTREFSGLAHLVRRGGRTRARDEFKTNVNTAPATAPSYVSHLIGRLTGSPLRVTLMLVGAAALITVAVLAWQWLPRSSARVDSVAVLPFKPLVAEARDEVLEMGLADTLITRLSNLKSVTVRPISAVRRYTALDQDPIAAGRELQVQAVLEGSIQKAGNKIRVTARLVNIADGRPLWTRQFDEHWTDIFAVQDALSERVAGDLMATLSGAERSELVRNYTTDPEAYSLYMEGRYHWGKRTGEGMRKSVESFQRAIQKDPDYALAYVGLANAYTTLGSYHLMAPKEALPQARNAAEQALQIDENLAEAHATLGKIFTDYDWDWARAEREFQRALALQPNCANAHHWYSTLLAHTGRFDEAVRAANRALELDQHSPVVGTQLGNVLYRARRYDQAITVLRKTLELEPKHFAALTYLGLCYVMQGRHEEALAVFQRSHQLRPDLPDFIALLGYTHALKGEREQARRYQKELDELAKRRAVYVSPFSRLAVHSGLGELDQVFQWLETCFEERDPSIRGLKTDPLYDNVRSDPRFAALLRRAGLTP